MFGMVVVTRRFLKDQGQNLIEYALMAAIVAIVVGAFLPQIQSLFPSMSNRDWVEMGVLVAATIGVIFFLIKLRRKNQAAKKDLD